MGMLLYIIQHAEAKREEEDPRRGLTDRGFDDIERVAVFAEKAGIRVGRIFHSGKMRALQTAEVLAHHLRPEDGVSQAEGLSPMDDPFIWFKRIMDMDEDVMLVGHLPHLARLADLLLYGDTDKGIIDFRMGCMLCLKRFDDGHWAVEWMVIPEVIR
ncbi:MAG: phosphohistidine phosphatase SixA [Thermodesulfovibrionia bacterium]